MLIKAGVDISRLNRDIRRALGQVATVLAWHNKEVVITSTYEGNHSPGSLHYGNDAFDIRLPAGNYQVMIKEIKERLGKDYDIVKMTTHIHIEYDPKT